MLMQEYYYYKAHQEQIIKDHLGEYVVLQGNSVLGLRRFCADKSEAKLRPHKNVL
jgi:hypothetical protein